MANFKVRFIEENNDHIYIHYEIIMNGKRFIDGWYKRWETYPQFIHLENGVIVERIKKLYSFLNKVL